MSGKFFIAVYTHECKQYCDERFFGALKNLTHPNYEVHIVDNTVGLRYTNRLKKISGEGWEVEHIDVPRHPRTGLFQRNVFQSVDRLRTKFLKTDCNHFVIFESDVLVPPNVLQLFEEVIDQADIIGGLYYDGFHKKEWWTKDELIPTHHVLSGCTLYSRQLVEMIPFRMDMKTLKAFPDAFICRDAQKMGIFRMANYTKIRCSHLHKKPYSRGLEDLK